MKFKWIAECSDGAFNDESALFDSEKECYNDMRNEVFKKMEWDTEYEAHFSKSEITHKSYRGLYTYKIVEVSQNFS